MAQADVIMGAAKAAAGTAKYSVKAGLANARNERLLASHIQDVEDINLQAVNKARREKVGEGITSFAANGVLVQSDAVGKWEQDEAADAVIEKLQIMQAAEDEAYNHLMAAQQKEAEGYANAASAYGQAAQTAASAYSTSLQAVGALQSAASVQGPSKLALALNIVGQLGSTVGGLAQAGIFGSGGNSSGIQTAKRIDNYSSVAKGQSVLRSASDYNFFY